ncbi:cysteine hydrolase family protein [Microbulbifer hydrolyticus]|uniref:Isochorismatase family protein n=1 Tax=Microbulbifer hydrolyticus TaxID=48074 RepID=A0A6P1TA77_9GAMM|nr:cysteine hydrolase family protein [Microbulbifer hydrolyticus]MBB5211730.1 nicotinamidase-related amidase [Microbulbifer hydrolyticus]QHQ37542.1 isochorismatase family protein [Microbulbifer hydrolyticus]
MFSSSRPALVIIDVQQAIDHFDSGYRNNPDAEKVIAKILGQWRDADLPIAHVRHASKFTESPYHPGSPYFEFKADAIPEQREKVFTKSENCAFIGTELDNWLVDQGVTEVVICGVLTNNSVDATVRVAAGLGYDVYVPAEATAAFPLNRLDGKYVAAEDVHWIFLSNLDGEYCRVCSADKLLSSVS